MNTSEVVNALMLVNQAIVSLNEAKAELNRMLAESAYQESDESPCEYPTPEPCEPEPQEPIKPGRMDCTTFLAWLCAPDDDQQLEIWCNAHPEFAGLSDGMLVCEYLQDEQINRYWLSPIGWLNSKIVEFWECVV